MESIMDRIDKVFKAGTFSSDFLYLTSCVSDFLAASPEIKISEELDSINESHSMLIDFARRGYDDPKRKEIYNRLLRRLYTLLLDIKNSQLVRDTHTLACAFTKVSTCNFSHESIQKNLEDFVSLLPFLMLDDENNREEKNEELYVSHQDYMSKLFDYILVSRQWAEFDAKFYSGLILSPLIDIRDAQIIVSAITLSLSTVFDVNKMGTLYDVIMSADNQRVRQRALVGFMLNVRCGYEKYFPEIGKMVKTLCREESIIAELIELQFQLFYAFLAKEDSAYLTNDVFPSIVKNQNIHLDKSGDFIEIDDDPMDDILGSRKTEERMAELEESMRKMVDMERAGSDIYFGGFSHMKRFPFFNTLSNWFCPFYLEHPALKMTTTKVGDKDILGRIISTGPFCDSDRYSFALAMATVFDRMPSSLKEMISSGAMTPNSGVIADANAPATIRRQYIQDIYRFFELFSYKSDFINPFDAEASDFAFLFLANPLFVQGIKSNKYYELCDFLVRKKCYRELGRLLEAMEHTAKDWEWYYYHGMCSYKRLDFNTAEHDFAKAASINSDDAKVLRMHALSSMRARKYDSAVTSWEKLIQIKPQNIKYKMNHCLSLIYINQTAKALNLAYELSLLDGKSPYTDRVLAWALLCDGRVADAIKSYLRLIDKGNSTYEDLLNLGYAYWFDGNIALASKYMSEFVNEWKNTEDYRLAKKSGRGDYELLMDKFNEDMYLLDKHHIDITDKAIISDMVLMK